MHTLKCKSIEELVEVVVETYELLHDCDRNVSFVAKYDHAKEILRELVFYDYDLKFVELADPEWDNYEDEYVISIVCFLFMYFPIRLFIYLIILNYTTIVI